ncbi:Uncharacterized protein SCF082_LOCUS47470 [Durusdinium trenchii]|uniref:Uncharacterized protein n=1 Tax=Durusdinium trenchii TaxID=1381693 RepID=A0ABP0RLK8_9DINO
MADPMKSSKRMKGPLLDVKGMAGEWDADTTVRGRLRTGKSFLHLSDGKRCEDIKTCIMNQEILSPLLTRMAVTDHRPIIPVEATQAEITMLLTMNKLEPGDLHNVEQDTWHIRKLLGFIKMKAEADAIREKIRLKKAEAANDGDKDDDDEDAYEESLESESASEKADDPVATGGAQPSASANSVPKPSAAEPAPQAPEPAALPEAPAPGGGKQETVDEKRARILAELEKWTLLAGTSSCASSKSRIRMKGDYPAGWEEMYCADWEWDYEHGCWWWEALYLDELHEDNEEIDLATNRDLLGMQTQLRMSGQAALDFFVSEAAAPNLGAHGAEGFGKGLAPCVGSAVFEWLEFFAGLGNLTRAMKSARYKSARFDLLDNQKPQHRKSNFMDLNSPSGFALATLCILRAVPGDFAAHFGIKCSSFCKVNVGTSMRSACTSIGKTDYPSVFLSNRLLERTCLLLLLCTALGGVWILEQPSGSLLPFYPAFREVMQSIFETGGIQAVQEVRWWMGSYGSATPKRHVAFANSCEILNLDKGKLVGWKKTEKTKVKTVEHYQDRHGKQRWKGTSKLRSTEHYPMRFARAVLDMVENLKASCNGQPGLPGTLPPALVTFAEMEWEKSDVWMFVDLPSVYTYLRCCRGLNIPPEWRPFVPKQLGSD